MDFNIISPYDYKGNVFDDFRNKHAICLFGNEKHHNGLTVGWGTMGILWSFPVCTCYVKPTRYSFAFANECKYFSIMWFDDKKIPEIFGKYSGKDVNKEELANVNLVMLDNAPCFKEASFIITLELVMKHEIKKEEIESIDVINKPLYNDNLFHSEYVGKIINMYERK